ncbi:uncharacterized protein si:dkey-106l3.7 [Melanotaenia boesemani]|uniref:uncharacterized protein si:dkey-106l3.7 n=1 Tax=Melanotaenia boesemani TaxID=1250792 RepID=UPI001C03A4C1|nr:uncharacterized protein si:dkey-106l3.7 [Melanotaenia boesemani]
MNLYSSFGNLMEAWVNKDRTCTGSEWIGNNAEDSPTSSDMSTNPCSESVDSGVETASCDTPCAATSCSVSTNNAEVDLITEPNEELTPGLTSQSPFPSFSVTSSSSSSSPRLCASRAEEVSVDLHLKVVKALQRVNSRRLKREDELHSRPPQASFPSKQHTPKSERRQRSESLGPRRRVAKQMSETHRRPLSVGCYIKGSEDLCVREKKELSPGLCYLEQVCQMLEEIARQMHNPELEHQDTQAPETCESKSPDADKEETTCQWLENSENAESISNEPQQRKYGHFRQRSVSDTTIATMHLRKKNANCRGQQLSTHDQLDTIEEDCKKQDLTKDSLKKTKKSWKLKFGSLRREESALSDTKGQQMHSSERNSTRRRFSQLLRGRRKTQPV